MFGCSGEMKPRTETGTERFNPGIHLQTRELPSEMMKAVIYHRYLAARVIFNLKSIDASLIYLTQHQIIPDALQNALHIYRGVGCSAYFFK